MAGLEQNKSGRFRQSANIALYKLLLNQRARAKVAFFRIILRVSLVVIAPNIGFDQADAIPSAHAAPRKRAPGRKALWGIPLRIFPAKGIQQCMRNILSVCIPHINMRYAYAAFRVFRKTFCRTLQLSHRLTPFLCKMDGAAQQPCSLRRATPPAAPQRGLGRFVRPLTCSR